MSQLIDQGEVALSHGDYDDAVKIFSKVLLFTKGSLETQLKVLDLRCQAYVKLGKRELALQDARHMVRIGKRHTPMGYIRCSQLERFSGNHAAAIRWLEHGMKHVPHARSIFAVQLKKVQVLAQTHTFHQRRQDPVTSMPLEILQIIFACLEYHDIVCLLRVSRAWRNILSRMSPLTTEIDFSHARQRVSGRSLKASLQRLCKRPLKLKLGPLLPPAMNTAQSWLANFTNLETLEMLQLHQSDLHLTAIRFDRLEKLKCLSIGQAQKLSVDKVFSIITTCQTLQKVVVHGIRSCSALALSDCTQTQLIHLELHTDRNSIVRLPASFVTHLPSLQNLSLVGGHIQPQLLELSDHQHLWRLRLELMGQTSIELRLPESLQELDCCGQCPLVGISDFTFGESSNLPILRKVAFRGSWAGMLIDALRKSNSRPILQTTIFEDVTQDILNRIACQASDIFSDCLEVTYLCHKLKDHDIDLFSRVFPRLERLVMEAPLITGAFISDLVKRGQPPIKEVILRNCSRVSSDITKWLEAQNIVCRTTNSLQELNGSRRICDT